MFHGMKNKNSNHCSRRQYNKITNRQRKVISNATEYTLEAPAEIDNGRTMVPVRFIVEMLGKTVQWSEDNRMVIISD